MLFIYLESIVWICLRPTKFYFSVPSRKIEKYLFVNINILDFPSLNFRWLINPNWRNSGKNPFFSSSIRSSSKIADRSLYWNEIFPQIFRKFSSDLKRESWFPNYSNWNSTENRRPPLQSRQRVVEMSLPFEGKATAHFARNNFSIKGHVCWSTWFCSS